MKLSQAAIDELLHIIEQFDRERGVPHNYHDLEKKLKLLEIDKCGEQLLDITNQKTDVDAK